MVTSNKRSADMGDMDGRELISSRKRRVPERGPLPEVKEGNSQADWDLWSDSVIELDSQFSALTGDSQPPACLATIKKTST